MATLKNDTVVRSADGQATSAIVTATNIGTYGVAANSTYYVGTTQNVFNRASGAQTLTGVSIDGNAANITAYTINQNVGSGNTPSFAGINSTAMLVSYTSLTNGDDWSNSPISIRERGLVSAAQSINAYSPNLNFHWGSRISNSLWMDANGNLAWGSYSETGVPSSDGAFYAANLYASIYYDKNDTTYYLDPANTGTSLLVAGKVGIGTTSAGAAKLQINVSSAIGITINGTGGYANIISQGGHLEFYKDGTPTFAAAIGLSTPATALSNDIQFATYNGSSWSARMTIANGGNVGIGTTSPGYKLDITGDARIASAAGAGALYFGTLDPSNVYLKVDNNYDLTLAQNASSGNGLYLAGAGNVYVSIDSNNNATADAFIVQNNAIKAGTELFRVQENGVVTASSDFRAPIFYDSNNTAYYCDPASTSVLAVLQATRINFGATGSTPYTSAAGEGFGNGITFGGDDNSAYYRIFTGMENVGGNYSKLTLNWHTGIRIGAYINYGGVRFYNNSVGQGGTEIFSVGNLDSNVRVVNNLIVNGITINQERANNARMYGAGTGAFGLLGLDSAGSFRWQVYGESGNYGFLDSTWGAWDIKKVPNGELDLRVSSANVRVLNAGNYSGYSAFTASLTSTVDARAPIFYDSNDTAYYVNPNSSSNLNTLSMVGTITGALDSTISFAGGACTAASYNYILSGANDGGNKLVIFVNGTTRSADGGVNALTIRNDGGTFVLGYAPYLTSILGSSVTINGNVALHAGNYGGYSAFSGSISSGGNITATGYVNVNSYVYSATYLQTGGNLIYPSSYSSTQRLEVGNSANNNWIDGLTIAPGGTVTAPDNMRSPIFYDSNDTAFYGDFASTSVLNRLNYQQLRRNFASTVYTGTAGSRTVKTFSGVLVGGSAIGGNSAYTVIETTIPQGAYQMGGFTIKWFENYSSTNAKTSIEIAGYWNPVSNGGFIGFEYTTSNPNVQPTIRVGANASGNTVFILDHFSSSYTVIIARDLWLGYDTTDGEWGTGWTMVNTTTIAAYSNIVSAVLRVGPTLTGTGASGTWSINVTGNAGGSSASCTGNSATTTLATKATRANGNFYIDDNYGNTVVGVYSASRYQGVFAMGDSYKLAADGSTTGSLYGIAWSHPNAGGAAGNLNTHGALIMENGTFLAALSGSIRCRDDMRSPLFYDSNNTNYYLDPANSGTSLLVAGKVGLGTTSAISMLDVRGAHASGYGIINVVSTDSALIALDSTGARDHGIRLKYNGVDKWLVGMRDTNESYSFSNSSDTRLVTILQGGNVGIGTASPSQKLHIVGTAYSDTDFRAPIFYDSNNTAYYIDGASGSKLKYLQIDGDWGSSPFGSGHESFTIRSTYASMVQRQTNGGLGYWLHHIASDAAYYLYGGKGATDGSSWDWSYKAYPNQDGSYVEFRTSARAPLFYDSNDTAYYVDPNGTSSLYNLSLVGAKNTYLIINPGNGYEAMVRYIGGSGSGWYVGKRMSSQLVGTADFHFFSEAAGATVGGVDTSGNIFSSGSVRSPIFYDSNNTAYYVDPASTGYSAYFAGAIQATKIGIEDAGLDCYMEITDANPTVYGVGYGGEFIFYGDKSTPASFLYYGGATVTYTLQANSSLRSPIFYDSNDTGYYCDPASNSVLNGLYVNAYYNLSNDYKDINVYGDVNTYYVVLIEGNYLYSFGRYSVTRGYNWTGPDTWYTASHKGGLTLDWEWSGDTAWGGNDKAIRIIEFNESYSTMVAGLGYPVNGGVIIWLRGGGVGGAQYRIRTPIGSNATVTVYDGVSATNHSTLTTFTASDSSVFTTRANANNVSAEILARYPVRSAASLYNDNNLVVDIGSGTQTKSGIFASAASVRAPIFYDTDNTGYYLDPASTSNLNAITAAGNITAAQYYTANWFRSTTSGNGLYNEATGQHFYSDSVNYWNVASSASAQGIRLRTGGHAGTVRGYFYATDSNDVGLLNQDGNWRLRVVGGDYSLADGSSMRAQLFYDSNNTAYYVDPAGTSVMNQINLAGVLRRTASAAGYLEGNYPTGVDGNSSSAIYTIGGGYQPAATNLGNMYGCGYTVGNGTANPGLGATGWGFYVAGGGVSRIFLDSEGGYGIASSSWRAPIFYDSNNTAYYTDPASTSNLLGLTVTNTITGSITGNAGGSSASCTGNAATATRTSGQSGYPHAGTGMWAFYNWGGNDGGTSAPSASTYTTGLSVGSNPGDQAYGFQIANNMWNTGLWTRNYNSSFGSWIRLLDSSNYVGYSAFTGNVDGTQFRDANDTGYYLDPAGTSNLNKFSTLTMSYNDMNPMHVNSPYVNRYNGSALYRNGTMGYGTVDCNHMFSNWGSGFIDSWSSPANAPGGSTHYVGFQGFHYNHQNNSQAYGFQMLYAGGSANRFFWRSAWPDLLSWVEMIHTGNIASQTVASCTGNAANVTGTVAIANGGTGATTAAAARANLGITTAETSSNQSLSGTTGCTIDVAAASVHILTLSSGTVISSFTYNNRSASPLVNTVLVVLKFAGSATITWSNVVWSNSTTPTLTGANGKADVYALTSYKGGATGPAWIGSVVGQNIDSTNL